jgi:putative hydrolase of the HAD superfamily
MIKNIFFDLGKVLVDYDFDSFFTRSGLNPNFNSLLPAREIIDSFNKGEIARQQFYLMMRDLYGFDLDQQQFEDNWCDVFWLNDDMVQFARKLSENYDIFILSNTDELHFNYIWQNFPALHFFDENLILSYKSGFIKPDRRIYEEGLKSFLLKPSESLFVDDLKENVKAAQKIGIESFIFESNEKTISQISKALTYYCHNGF